LSKGETSWRLLSPAALLCVLASCSGTWVDDDGNFKRVFGFSKPGDMTVIHSYYWKSPHWSAEYQYFIALQASSKFVDGLTSSELMITVASDRTVLDACRAERPQWFLPKSLGNYEVWVPKPAMHYRVFRDRTEGALFVCD
jgi:hypothetical protein